MVPLLVSVPVPKLNQPLPVKVPPLVKPAVRVNVSPTFTRSMVPLWVKLVALTFIVPALTLIVPLLVKLVGLTVND